MNFGNQSSPSDFMQLIYYNFLLSLYNPLGLTPPQNQTAIEPIQPPFIEQKPSPSPPPPEINKVHEEPEKTPEDPPEKKHHIAPKKPKAAIFAGSKGSKKHFCNCNKTNCLKLYCDCFSNGELCDDDCRCKGCNNCEKSMSLRNQVISNIKLKNPFAFENKYLKEKIKKVNNKGCNCKRSHCMKKYCDCFLEGCFCSANCRCEDCLNKSNDKNSIKGENTIDNPLTKHEASKKNQENHKIIIREFTQKFHEKIQSDAHQTQENNDKTQENSQTLKEDNKKEKLTRKASLMKEYTQNGVLEDLNFENGRKKMKVAGEEKNLVL